MAQCASVQIHFKIHGLGHARHRGAASVQSKRIAWGTPAIAGLPPMPDLT